MTERTNPWFTLSVDDLVLARAKRGDGNAHEKIFHTFAAEVHTLARRLSRSAEDAEDIVQETFLEVFRSLPRFRGDGSLAGWVRRVAASKALQRLRRHRGHEVIEEDDDGRYGASPAAAEPVLARVDLEAALDRLGETARTVIWLHDVEGYSHEEIAELMGRTASFSKSQLARAHARLRRHLA